MNEVIKLEQIETKLDKKQTRYSVDEAILGMIISNPSITDQELAKTLGVSRQTVNRKRNSDYVQAHISKAFQVSDVWWNKILHKAMQTYEEALNSEDIRIRLFAASQIAKIARPQFDRFLQKRHLQKCEKESSFNYKPKDVSL